MKVITLRKIGYLYSSFKLIITNFYKLVKERTLMNKNINLNLTTPFLNKKVNVYLHYFYFNKLLFLKQTNKKYFIIIMTF